MRLFPGDGEDIVLIWSLEGGLKEGQLLKTVRDGLLAMGARERDRQRKKDKSQRVSSNNADPRRYVHAFSSRVR